MKRSRSSIIRKIYLVAIVIASFFMSIGYASIDSVTMDINGTAEAEIPKNVFITNANINQSSNANLSQSHINLFHETLLNSTVVLNDNVNSTLTIDINVKNNSNDDLYFDQVVYDPEFYDNNNIDFTLSNISHGDLLTKGSSTSFSITFKYTDSYKASNPTTFANMLNSYLNFKYKKGYAITYSNITNTTNYPSLILEGNTLTVTFSNDIPDDVKVFGLTSNTEYVKGTDFTYTNNTLTFTNVTEPLDIQKTAVQGSGTGTQEDPYVETGNEYDPTDAEDDASTIFVNVPGEPQITKDEDGEVTSFEYTAASDDNPVIFDSEDPLSTGLIAMDGDGFTIHIKFKTDLEQENSNFIISALEYDSASNTYNGFSLFDYNRGYLRVGTYRNRARSTSTGLLNANNYVTANSSAITGMHEFDVTIVYDPVGNKSRYGQITFTTIIDGGTPTVKTMKNSKAPGHNNNVIPETLTNAVVTIGGNGINDEENIGYMEILEFSVAKN